MLIRVKLVLGPTSMQKQAETNLYVLASPVIEMTLIRKKNMHIGEEKKLEKSFFVHS